jgi:branched-subunit amino acid ABC-type transport system permease component
MVPEVASPQHYVPATARELRAQSVHRLQIGLFGLAAMLLIVGLANIIMDRARLGDATAAASQDASASATAANDPLADMGVVPAPAPTTGQAKRPLGH